MNTTMQLGMIGLGRVGANIVRRLIRKGHECVVYSSAGNFSATGTPEGNRGARG